MLIQVVTTLLISLLHRMSKKGKDYHQIIISVYTANEGLVRIQYKCLVPIHVFPEIKLCSLVISKTEL
jgi:hypothetical protein